MLPQGLLVLVLVMLLASPCHPSVIDRSLDNVYAASARQ